MAQMKCPHCAGLVGDTDQVCPHCGKGMVGREALGSTMPINATPAITIVLMLVAIVVAFVGFGSLTQATLGVGLVGVACLLAIWARIAQAAAHHTDLMQR